MQLEQKYLNLGRAAFIIKNAPKNDELEKLTKIISSIPIHSVEYFLFKKGYFYELGRKDRLDCKVEGIITLETIKDIPKSYENQSNDSQINELQIMYDLGYDNPEKYNDGLYYMSNSIFKQFE